MQIQRAEKLIEKLLAGDTQIGKGDRRVEPDALRAADSNGDGTVDKQELVRALSTDRIRLSRNRLVPAKTVSFSESGTSPNSQAGLKGAHWSQSDILAGGDPAKPMLGILEMSGDESYDGSKPTHVFTEVGTYIYDLAGKTFDEVAREVDSPEEVTMYLGRNLTYDDGRAEDKTGTWAAYSSDEMLDKQTGVCRDQHALARDLLVAAGYEAKLLAYSSSDQFHAIAVYKDPKTGNWGLIEYGTHYPANELQAKTAEEALLRVRPGTMVIWHMRNAGPHERSVADRATYTPNYRMLERMTAGPTPGSKNQTTLSNKEVSSYYRLGGPQSSWTGGMAVALDPRRPDQTGTMIGGVWKDFDRASIRVGFGAGYMPGNTEYLVGSNAAYHNPRVVGFASLEESHPELLNAPNVFGSGVDVSLSSHNRAHIITNFDVNEPDDRTSTGDTLGMSGLKSDWSLNAERSFDFWRASGADTRIWASYGLGIDGGLQAAHLAMGGKSLLTNQFVTVGVDTKPAKDVTISTMGYVPVTHVTNDVAATPTARLEVRTPHAAVGTTQSVEHARYDAQLSVRAKQLEVTGFGIVDHDRQTQQISPTVGLGFTVYDRVKGR